MSKWSNTRTDRGQAKKIRNLSSLMMASVLTPLLSVPAFAQGEVAEEEIVVTGTRQVIQDQIAIKRNAVGVVDGLSSSEIGELPALSIGEALESITGVASHRENGGATEVTIRGLGPFLSMTTFNGREATNGSGDRSVNFSQFPSELMNKIAVVKTQTADMIEGGVAGVIALETLQPLDYGKRRFQIDGKLNWNPDEQNVDNKFGDDIGTRIGASYVDQFEFDNGMALGWSLGGQLSRITQPESEVRSSGPTGTSIWPCINDLSVTNEGAFRSSDGDCEDQVGGDRDQGFNTSIVDGSDPAVSVSNGLDYYWTGSSKSYRQNETADERDAVFMAVQFQPNEQWDINFDMQLSERDQKEDRHDLLFETKRITNGTNAAGETVSITGAYLNDALIYDPVNETYDYNLNADGTLNRGDNAPINNEPQQFYNESDVVIAGELASRLEKYAGGGLAITYTPTDALTLDLDISRSRTTRRELQIINEVRTSDRIPVAYERDSSTGAHLFSITNFDVTNSDLFLDTDRLRTRVDNEAARENIVEAVRFDLAYDIDRSFIKTIKGGVRTSSLSYLQLGGEEVGNGANNGSGARLQLEVPGSEEAAAAQSIIDQCEISFPESSFLSAVNGPIITNSSDVLDPNATVNAAGTGNSYVAFDNQCFSDGVFAFSGQTFEYPELSYENSETIDVQEDTVAAYVLADYEFDNGLRGNFGVRVLQTDVTSTGFRSAFNVREEDGQLTVETLDGVQSISGGSSYTEVLPSAQFVYDLNDEMVVRGGIFRGLSRVDPGDMGFQRTFSFAGDDTISTVEELVSGITGSGNPNAEPFLSWNTDLAWEWYPDDDTILAVGLYHKRFSAGIENTLVSETFDINNQDFVTDVALTGTSDESSNLYGVEITGSYRWDIGVGVKVSYNHAETDFEFDDSRFGDLFDVNGEQTNIGIIEPASMPGFSEDVFSGQVYYQIGEFDIAAIYKYRSSYFQQFTTDGTRLRFVDGRGVWEARASYRLNDIIKFKVEAINLFSQERTDSFYTEDNFYQLSDYGPRVFVGVSAKF